METLHDDGRGGDTADVSAARPVGDQQQGLTLHPARQNPAAHASGNNGGVARSMAEPHKAREGGAFIDRALRERVDGDISAFLTAFDAALADDTIRKSRRAAGGDGPLAAGWCPYTYRTGASRGSRAVIGTGPKWVLRSELAAALNCRPGFFDGRLSLRPLLWSEIRSEEGLQGRVRNGLALICAQIYADILRHPATIEQ